MAIWFRLIFIWILISFCFFSFLFFFWFLDFSYDCCVLKTINAPLINKQNAYSLTQKPNKTKLLWIRSETKTNICCLNAFIATKSTQINYLSLTHQNRSNKPSFGQRIRSHRLRCRPSTCWCLRWLHPNCRRHHHWRRSYWAPIILLRAPHCIRWIFSEQSMSFVAWCARTNRK